MTQKNGYDPVVDGLRALAIAAVFIYHLNPEWLPGGFYGVDIFFVISGYLITRIILTDLSSGRFSVRDFYRRRIARIFPVYLLVVVGTLCVAWLLYGRRDFASTGALAVASAVFATNMKLLNQGSYFEIQPDTQPLLHFWSLAVEEQFYLFFPFALFLLSKIDAGRRSLPGWIAGLGVLSFTLCAGLEFLNKPTWSFYLFPSRAWELLAGCWLAVHVSNSRKAQSGASLVLSRAFSTLGLALVGVGMGLPAFLQEKHFTAWMAIPVVLGTVLLIKCSIAGGVVNRLLSLAPLTYTGLLSYSLYMWHWPIFCFVDYHWFDAGAVDRTAMKILLSIPISILSYHFFEKPLRKILNKPSAMLAGWRLLACGCAGLMAAGIFIRKTQYVSDASLKDVASGGIVFNSQVQEFQVALVGDSIASMYATAMRDLARDWKIRAHILSVHSQSPVPGSELWRATMEFLRRERPSVVIFSTAWEAHFADPEVLRRAVHEILQTTGHVILVVNPPILPKEAARANIRKNGLRPFFETKENSGLRLVQTERLMSFQNDGVTVIDVDELSKNADGSLRIYASNGKFFYRDSTHVDVEGAEEIMGQLIKPELEKIYRAKPRAN